MLSLQPVHGDGVGWVGARGGRAPELGSGMQRTEIVFMGMRLKRVAAVVYAIFLVLTLGGIAFAFWTAGGSGSGTATAGTNANVTVNQTVSPTGLYPGATTALSGDFNNSNSGGVYITAVTASVTPFSVQADGTKPACTQADFSITGTANVGTEIVPGTGVGSWSGLSLNMIDAATNQDNCKNVTVPIAYAVT
jgi:hypothetical protein